MTAWLPRGRIEEKGDERRRFEKAGRRASFDPSIACLRVNDAVSIGFGVAIWRKHEGRPVRWTLCRRARWPAGWIVAIKSGKNNESILDYILLPSAPRDFAEDRAVSR